MTVEPISDASLARLRDALSRSTDLHLLGWLLDPARALLARLDRAEYAVRWLYNERRATGRIPLDEIDVNAVVDGVVSQEPKEPA